eukprot:CAMPEP_0168583610 /NCGR_PEP_ID=MMETSP0420-20121227/2667_1 /TAXON_ID=498008 /ORGANISM="Pessonella sp." /LENGTH=148 /DNA_ID=CAMNT_0008618295 /DNA_START=497 /DNA_END=939 /DNA_ORIENTATION=+
MDNDSSSDNLKQLELVQDRLLGQFFHCQSLSLFASSLLPRQPKSRPRMAFGRARGLRLKQAWLAALSQARQDEQRVRFDILVTHTPPHGVLDNDAHIGDEQLTKLFLNSKLAPALHLFGHCHASRGVCVTRRTVFVNCASAPVDHRDA